MVLSYSADDVTMRLRMEASRVCNFTELRIMTLDNSEKVGFEGKMSSLFRRYPHTKTNVSTMVDCDSIWRLQTVYQLAVSHSDSE